MFIDKTYFINDINLPGSVLDGNLASIDSYIDKYEKEALISLLGYTVYKDLVTNQAETTGMWGNLITGTEYEVTYNGQTHTVKWNGFKNDDKISLLAYYVYFQFIRDNITSTSVIGEVLNASENAKRVTPADKMVYAYNRYVDLYGKTNDNKLQPSAYRYLKENESDFEKWVFTVQSKINTFGI